MVAGGGDTIGDCIDAEMVGRWRARDDERWRCEKWSKGAGKREASSCRGASCAQKSIVIMAAIGTLVKALIARSIIVVGQCLASGGSWLWRVETVAARVW